MLTVCSESLNHIATIIFIYTNKTYEKTYGITCPYLNIKIGYEYEFL